MTHAFLPHPKGRDLCRQIIGREFDLSDVERTIRLLYCCQKRRAH